MTRLFTIATLVAIVVLSLLLIRANARLATLNAESGALASELKGTRAQLDQAQRLLTAQEIELSALVKQRIPGVTPLQLDRLFDINKGIVNKVSFSESGIGESRRFSCYAVLQNNTNTPVTPKVSILVFDSIGLQVGSASLTRESATPAATDEALAPGEKRTYTATIEQSRSEDPAYFVVEVR